MTDKCNVCIHNQVCGIKQEQQNSFCKHFSGKNDWIKMPLVAMIEQFIGESGEFSSRVTAHNGKTAVVYRSFDKWGSPLIDVTNQFYKDDVAQKRIAAIEQERKNRKK